MAISKRYQRSLLTGLAGLAASAIFTMQAPAASPDVDKRVEQLLSQMTPAEKIQLLGGVDGFYTRDIPRLHIPRFKMSDGPVGTRNDGKTTAYPAGALLAATWDPAIAHREGESLGSDGRSRGDYFLLGPGVNIYREPQNGRNFEYFGEDPYLAGQIDSAYIQGVQSQGVAACVKHYDCNNQETRRDDVNVIVDERTLHEIYLPAFEAAVKQGHVQSIMASYNKINGHYATANHYLLTDVLRTEWGFQGVAMSDWGAVHDTFGPMMAGLDLEMPGPDFMNAKKLQPLIDDSRIPQAVIDDKIRHLLHTAVEMGWLDRPQLDKSIPRDNPQSDATALAVAREGIVLLKNEGNLLPLNRAKVHNIVLLGPGADRYVAGGGSSYAQPTRPVTVMDGMKALAGNVNITNIPFTDWQDQKLSALAKASAFVAGATKNEGPLTATFYNNPDLSGNPVLSRTDTSIDFNWHQNLPAPEVTQHAFSARWTGSISPATSGPCTFVVRSDDGSRVLLDGKVIVDNWHDQRAHTQSATIDLEAQHVYQLKVEYYNTYGDASLQFAYFPARATFTPEQKSALAAADAAVVCVHTRESEGADRSYDLPAEQERLIAETVAVNPHTIVLLEAGGNVGMKNWIDHVPALVDAWFPGQAGGKAIGEVLFGDVNPSGHLPDSFEKVWADAPAYGNYPGGDNVKYVEGLYVGYRWFDKKKIEPRYPFGYGLSYTTFDMKNLKLTPGPEGTQTASIDVTNTGPVAGATVAQLYVRPPADEAVDRPVQELKGFARTELKPGETRTLSMPLDMRSFAHWDVATHSWQVVSGTYEIAVGQSSRDISATTTVQK
jgi:beta-glucosidase